MMAVDGCCSLSEANALRAELDALKASLIDEGAAAGAPWKLSPTERRIFGMLIAQDIVSKATIARMLPGRKRPGDLKAIDVFVARLRGKTSASGVKIETIFGVGYRLQDREAWRKAISWAAETRH